MGTFQKINTIGSALLLASLLFLLPSANVAADQRPNVLMIWVDDLRPEITTFGAEGMKTPGIDQLARQSITFDRAYCNIPVCGASRASVMTGLRGTPDRFVDYTARADEDAPDAVALHELFHNNGYNTAFYGKVFHNAEDSAEAWDQTKHFKHWPGYIGEEAIQQLKEQRKKNRNGPPWEAPDVEDTETWDGKIAAATEKAIKQLATKDKPFFIATGFLKPHLPFVAPKKYWDLYPTDEITLPQNLTTRPNAPGIAFTKWEEMRKYAGMPQSGPIDPEDAQKVIAGYRACVSFIDAQIAHVLDSLEASGVADNTIIVLLGDHGWNLGEHGMWAKHCCFETSMRTPLMISAPMLEEFKAGKSTKALTEFVDIYPTLCELAGLETPKDLEGESAVSVLIDPSASHRDFAIGRFHKGDTIRTDRFRYTIFHEGTGEEIGQMLYDHSIDPAEDHNLAKEQQWQSTVRQLRRQLADVTGQ
ncbi:sulfatase [Rubellicoccus peritrichatus]|uniref:Sulfatase n=1 Tax=Rubellicoccus peritrichatus TaxID=3080537 RepID=A0AAQ3L882_9BACT|nr:sulfatase [Puniceicoccus sp. CR14]WOO40691.1 sulfatase [Puniceicoccus sp. CR14]